MNMQWSDTLLDLDFVVRHRPGIRIGHVDASSHMLLERKLQRLKLLLGFR